MGCKLMSRMRIYTHNAALEVYMIIKHGEYMWLGAGRIRPCHRAVRAGVIALRCVMWEPCSNLTLIAAW